MKLCGSLTRHGPQSASLVIRQGLLFWISEGGFSCWGDFARPVTLAQAWSKARRVETSWASFQREARPARCIIRPKEPNTKQRKFEDMVMSAEQAAGLGLVY